MTRGPRRLWQGEAQTRAIATAGRFDPRAIAFVRRFVRPAVRLCHRPILEGAENLPAEGPYLLVANHSGGLALAELECFAALWIDAFPTVRPIAGFAHPLGFRVYPISRILPLVGAIPSSYEAAHATLAAGVPILIFPGGDHESLRPIWQWRRVDFGGRNGFLRIARAANVPIVPMGIAGSHFTAPLLWRSELLAWLAIMPRAAGIKRWSISLFGVLMTAALWSRISSWPLRAFVAWIFLGTVFAVVPWVPARIRFRIGAPIVPESLFGRPAGGEGDEERDDDVLAEARARVERAVEALVRAK